ncbi:hypothetical protein F0562_032642 [Nyssa sinensis]|uniref:Retrotransposon Copia-like N-terminal domain-containing protein n=1 Tax=Nyssa sinensis TaxID=561372 RepID=A0A5J5AS48_9ASTE|nr:hypothetical protein F0562_032642 [Nyssa sinensis]
MEVEEVEEKASGATHLFFPSFHVYACFLYFLPLLTVAARRNSKPKKQIATARAMADVKKDEGSSGLDKKTFSPYTLNANDNPGNIITQVQLKGENYDEWARAMRTALRAKKKYGFIDGTVKQPADGSLELEDWWTVNSMLISWVFNTIEPTLCSTISYMENVKDLWEDIKQRFSIGNGPQVQQLRSDLANCKQDGQAIITYYGRLKTLWDELNNYD